MNELLRLCLIVLSGYLLLQVLNRQNLVSNQGSVAVEPVTVMPTDRRGKNNTRRVAEPAPVENVEEPSASDTLEQPANCFPKNQLNAADLLPKDKNSKWAEVNPEGQGELKDRNFVEAGWHFGVNTQGQSLRNANYGIRSEPSNPQAKVSPWNQSTIGPDTNRRPLEIGGDC